MIYSISTCSDFMREMRQAGSEKKLQTGWAMAKQARRDISLTAELSDFAQIGGRVDRYFENGAFQDHRIMRAIYRLCMSIGL